MAPTHNDAPAGLYTTTPVLPWFPVSSKPDSWTVYENVSYDEAVVIVAARSCIIHADPIFRQMPVRKVATFFLQAVPRVPTDRYDVERLNVQEYIESCNTGCGPIVGYDAADYLPGERAWDDERMFDSILDHFPHADWNDLAFFDMSSAFSFARAER